MVEVSYERLATIFKALSDETRLHIIDMLSCNELCAADILASFNLSQSTLSYHMKILIDAGVVNSQRNGLWTRYSINEATFGDILEIIPQLYKSKDECICAQIKYCRISEHEKRSVTMRRWIMHVDMDAFFASIEQLDHPEYKGHPVIVGGLSSRWRRCYMFL